MKFNIDNLENVNGIYINKNKPIEVNLDFDQSKFKTGDEKIYVKDSFTGKRYYVLILRFHNEGIRKLICEDIRMNDKIDTEIEKMFTYKRTCRTNGFIIQSTVNYNKKNKKLILDDNIGLVPENETYIAIQSAAVYFCPIGNNYQFWTTKKLIEKIEKDASDYSGDFNF